MLAYCVVLAELVKVIVKKPPPFVAKLLVEAIATRVEATLVVMASNLVAMASNLVAMTSNPPHAFAYQEWF